MIRAYRLRNTVAMKLHRHIPLAVSSGFGIAAYQATHDLVLVCAFTWLTWLSVSILALFWVGTSSPVEPEQLSARRVCLPGECTAFPGRACKACAKRS